MITIRNASPADVPALLDIYSYYVEHTAVTFDIDMPSPEEFGDKMKETLKKYPYLVAEEDGCIVGYAYAGIFKNRAAYQWSCEMTIYLDHHKERQGIGRRLYEALETELKNRGIRNLYACISWPIAEDEYLTRNSEQFHARMGYHLAGRFTNCGYKFGRWYSMIWMEKFL